LKRTENLALLVVLAVGLALRLGFLLVAGEHSLVTVVTDDAYYYFKTARNIAAGLGPTFDGMHPTDGFHPLWMGLLVPLAALVSGAEAFVRTALASSVVLGAATAVLVWRLTRRLTASAGIAFIATVLYWLNPRAVLSSLNGLETSLATLLFAAALLLVARKAEEPALGAVREAGLGVVLGLMFLARTDTVFYAAALYVSAVALAPAGARLRRAVVVGLVAAVFAVPWVLWCWLRFGSPVPSSGLSIPYVEHELFRATAASPLALAVEGLRRFAVVLYEGLRGEIGYPRPFSGGIVGFTLLVLAVRWRDPLGCTPGRRRVALTLLGLFAAAFALVFVHTAIRWYPRPWYFDQLLVLLPVFLGLGLAVFEPRRTLGKLARLLYPGAPHDNWLARSLGAALALALLAVPAAISVRRLTTGDWPWAKEMLDAALWLERNTSPGDVVGAFNAGILGYYSGRAVVNLDGAINNAAYRALKERKLAALMQEARMKWLVDFAPATISQFEPFFGRPLVKHLVKTIDRPEVSWCGSRIEIYELRWPEP